MLNSNVKCNSFENFLDQNKNLNDLKYRINNYIMIPPRHILLVLAEFFYSLAEILTSKIFGPGPKGPGPIISKSYYDY